MFSHISPAASKISAPLKPITGQAPSMTIQLVTSMEKATITAITIHTPRRDRLRCGITTAWKISLSVP